MFISFFSFLTQQSELRKISQEYFDDMALKGWCWTNFGYRYKNKKIKKISIGYSLPKTFSQENARKYIVFLTEKAILQYNSSSKIAPLFEQFPITPNCITTKLRLFDRDHYPLDTLHLCTLEKGEISYFYSTPDYVRSRAVREEYAEARQIVLGEQVPSLEELNQLIPQLEPYPSEWLMNELKKDQQQASKREARRASASL